MKPFFRWQTEEEESWEEEHPADGKSPSRRWLPVVAAILILGVFFVYWRQIRQVNQEEQRIQGDVLAANKRKKHPKLK